MDVHHGTSISRQALSIGKGITKGGKTKEKVPKLWEMSLELKMGARSRILKILEYKFMNYGQWVGSM